MVKYVIPDEKEDDGQWKVCISIPDKECDLLEWHDYDSKPLTVDLPYLPRIGETIWLSEEQDEYMRSTVFDCWLEHHAEGKCDDCPFMWKNHTKHFDDYMFVGNIIYDNDEKRIYLELSKEYPKK